MSGPTTLVVLPLSIALLAGCAPAKHHAAQVFGGGTAPQSYAGIAGGIGTQSGVSVYRAFAFGPEALRPYPTTTGFYDGGYNAGPLPALGRNTLGGYVVTCYDDTCVYWPPSQSWEGNPSLGVGGRQPECYGVSGDSVRPGELGYNPDGTGVRMTCIDPEPPPSGF